MPRFSQTLRDHAQYPSNRGKPASTNATGRASVNNNPPFIVVHLQIDEQKICSSGFESDGCGVTTAICSALTELVEGRSLEQSLQITADEIATALDGIPADKAHCVQIAIQALNNAINCYLENQP